MPTFWLSDGHARQKGKVIKTCPLHSPARRPAVGLPIKSIGGDGGIARVRERQEDAMGAPAVQGILGLSISARAPEKDPLRSFDGVGPSIGKAFLDVRNEFRSEPRIRKSFRHVPIIPRPEIEKPRNLSGAWEACGGLVAIRGLRRARARRPWNPGRPGAPRPGCRAGWA